MSFTANVRLQLIVTDIHVNADSLTEAAEKAKAIRETDVIRSRQGDYLDGYIEVIGVDVDGGYALDKED